MAPTANKVLTTIMIETNKAINGAHYSSIDYID